MQYVHNCYLHAAKIDRCNTWSFDSQKCRGRPTRRVSKGCHEANVEPTDVEVKRQHALPSSSSFCMATQTQAPKQWVWFGRILLGKNKGSQSWSPVSFIGCIEGVPCKQKHFLQQGRVLEEMLAVLWQNFYSCCTLRRWPQKNYKTDLDTIDYGCSFSAIASICRWPSQPNNLAEPMERNFIWRVLG